MIFLLLVSQNRSGSWIYSCYCFSQLVLVAVQPKTSLPFYYSSKMLHAKSVKSLSLVLVWLLLLLRLPLLMFSLLVFFNNIAALNIFLLLLFAAGLGCDLTENRPSFLLFFKAAAAGGSYSAKRYNYQLCRQSIFRRLLYQLILETGLSRHCCCCRVICCCWCCCCWCCQ